MNKEYYFIALDCPEFNLMLKLLFCCFRSEMQCWWDWCLVIDLYSLVPLHIEHITATKVLIYYCMKLCWFSRNRSVKNVTGSVYVGSKWSGVNNGQVVSRVSIRGKDPTLWYSPPYRQVLWWGFWASACGSHFSWSMPSFKSPPHPIAQKNCSSWGGTPLLRTCKIS